MSLNISPSQSFQVDCSRVESSTQSNEVTEIIELPANQLTRVAEKTVKKNNKKVIVFVLIFI